MGTPNYPRDMSSEWNQMKKDVKNAFTSANLRTGMAKIGAKVIEITGSLIMNAGAELVAKYANGVNALRVGESSFNGQPVGHVILKRYNGSTALQVFGGEGEPGFFAIHDGSGNIIVSDDSGSGLGLARPWLSYNVTRTADLTNPPDKSTSTTFVAHHSIFGYQQHPKITVRGFVFCSSGDSAEIRIKDTATGTVIVTSSVFSSSNWLTLEGNHVNYNFGETFQYDIEVRRTTGTGSGVGFTPVRLYGKQT